MQISGSKIKDRIHELGKVGAVCEGGRTRLAASDADKAGRDLVAAWMKEAGLEVVIDRIGNLFGIWNTEENSDAQPVMTGSHIDTVINAGQFDGCLGVIAGIEAITTLKAAGVHPKHPLIVGAFTNEEGVRYAPDMMGSLVYAGGLAIDEALKITGVDGTVIGEELQRIGYAGTVEPGFVVPAQFVELHIEQGPILDAENIEIGAVDTLQGIHWQRITIQGSANHAGTTPTSMRTDAGLAAAKVNLFLRQLVEKSGGVATIGTIAFEPNAVNVIPSKAVFTVDLRNPNKEKLDLDDLQLTEYLHTLEQTDGVRITTERMSHFDPVDFDEEICRRIEQSAQKRGYSVRRIVSGAGQDAQMLARICPTAMIFVPSVNGISHNPAEFTSDDAIQKGADVLLDVLYDLACQ